MAASFVLTSRQALNVPKRYAAPRSLQWRLLASLRLSVWG